MTHMPQRDTYNHLTHQLRAEIQAETKYMHPQLSIFAPMDWLALNLRILLLADRATSPSCTRNVIGPIGMRRQIEIIDLPVGRSVEKGCVPFKCSDLLRFVCHAPAR